LFIGGSINAWIISKLCDVVYQRARVVGNLIRRLKPGDGVVTVILDHWFDSSGMLVRIECKLRADEPRDVADALIAVALRQANSLAGHQALWQGRVTGASIHAQPTPEQARAPPCCAS